MVNVFRQPGLAHVLATSSSLKFNMKLDSFCRCWTSQKVIFTKNCFVRVKDGIVSRYTVDKSIPRYFSEIIKVDSWCIYHLTIFLYFKKVASRQAQNTRPDVLETDRESI